eukprot:4223970-Alexandrium_andersonii.AAC.1
MSASLVGSEMCIRDREALRGARRPRLPALSSGGGQHPPLWTRGRGRGYFCLLYTSDAADDM